MSTVSNDDTATASHQAGIPRFELRHRLALALEWGKVTEHEENDDD